MIPQSRNCIFLDSNAGAPIHPIVMAALSAFLREQASDGALGNPSSAHGFGRRGAALIEQAAEAVLRTLKASPDTYSVVFTGSGTEANQLAIRAVLEREIEKGSGLKPAWFVSPLEHSCVLNLIEPMRARGVDVRLLPITPQGEVRSDVPEIEKAALISMMGLNNETGIRQGSFATSLTSHIQSGQNSISHAVHTDYVAGWGKADLDLSKPGAPDLVAIAGHKLGALSGIGALVSRKPLGIVRAGTENLIGIRSLLAVAENWSRIREETAALHRLRDDFERELKLRFRSVRISGEGMDRAPHLSHFYFAGLPKALSLVAQLDLQGYAVSAGSACASSVPEPSHVLLAMGVPKIDALNALRISLHPGNTAEDLTGLLDALSAIIKRHEAA